MSYLVRLFVETATCLGSGPLGLSYLLFGGNFVKITKYIGFTTIGAAVLYSVVQRKRQKKVDSRNLILITGCDSGLGWVRPFLSRVNVPLIISVSHSQIQYGFVLQFEAEHVCVRRVSEHEFRRCAKIARSMWSEKFPFDGIGHSQMCQHFAHWKNHYQSLGQREEFGIQLFGEQCGHHVLRWIWMANECHHRESNKHKSVWHHEFHTKFPAAGTEIQNSNH